MKFAFRVDASREMGIGHLMRCLALTEELTKKNHNCFFFSKINDKALIDKIKNYDVVYRQIPLDSTFTEELKALVGFSKGNNIDWIITDNYGINTQYIKYLKQNRLNILSIDDTAQIHYYSDIVVNQNVGAEKLVFSAENYTKFLLGQKYVMLRDDILKENRKRQNSTVKKILITFGGADNDNFTLKILKLLESVDENVEILVVLGPFNRFYDSIKRHIEETSLEIKLISSPENMAKVYLKSDIAISTGGSSCYELAYFGIPNIIVTIADNQLNIAHELDKRKVGICLGKKYELKAEQFKYNVKELISNRSLWKRMSQNGKRLVDGKGKERIVDFMERFN